jgi:hypothetical protein
VWWRALDVERMKPSPSPSARAPWGEGRVSSWYHRDFPFTFGKMSVSLVQWRHKACIRGILRRLAHFREPPNVGVWLGVTEPLVGHAGDDGCVFCSQLCNAQSGVPMSQKGSLRAR